MKKKDLEGITLKNFMKHAKYQIQTRHPVDEGFEKNLKRSLKKHFSEILFGVDLIAKTYGIRNLVGNEEYILPMACFIMSIPLFMLILAFCYDSRNMRIKAKAKLDEKNKILDEKKK